MHSPRLIFHNLIFKFHNLRASLMIGQLQTSALTTEDSNNCNSVSSPSTSPLKKNLSTCKNESEMLEIKIISNETPPTSPDIFIAAKANDIGLEKMETNNTRLDLETDVSDKIKTRQSQQGGNNYVVDAEDTSAKKKKTILQNNKSKLFILFAVIIPFLYSIKKGVVTFCLLLSRILSFFPNSAIKTYNFCVSCDSNSESSGSGGSLCSHIANILGKFFYWCKDLVT